MSAAEKVEQKFLDGAKPPVAVIDPAWAKALEGARDEITKALGADRKANGRQPMFVDGADILSADFPQAVWAIVGLLTRNGVGVIGGEPKTTKTWMALAMAISVATGTKAFGEFGAEPGTAAYFFCEDQGKQVRNRLRSLLAGMSLQLEPQRLFVQPRGKFLDITRDEDLAWLIASCRRLGRLALLVLDPLRDLHSAEEDKSDSMRDVMRRLRLLSELLDCTVLVVHHTAKASDSTSKRRPGQRLRGSSAIHGSIDSGLYLSEANGGDGATLFRDTVITEVKGARSAGAFTLELAIEDDTNGEAVMARYRFQRSEPKAEAKDSNQQHVLRWVAGLAKRGVALSRRKLRERDDRPLSEAKTEAALNALIELGRLELADDTGAVVLPHTSDGKTWNDFAGARGAKLGQPQPGAVGRTPIGVPHTPRHGEDVE